VRQILSTAVVALIVGSLAGATVSVMAQEPASVAPAAGIDADRVDGKHAVGAGATVSARRNKLVATNTNGYLPKNIVKGLVTRVSVTTVESVAADASSPGEFTSNTATCPEGSVVTGGGYGLGGVPLVIFYMSRATDARTWSVGGWNPADGGGASVTAYAHCLSTIPAGSAIAGKRSAFGPQALKVREP
jgi:hypothetical protein